MLYLEREGGTGSLPARGDSALADKPPVAPILQSTRDSMGSVRRGDRAYELKPILVRRQGDVLRMIGIPRLAAWFPPESVSCTQVVGGARQAPYRDEPDSPVLVLGDSFLRIYERDEPRSAGFVAHLARELGFPMTSLINDGGASTLVRQELYRRPELLAGKKVVVWEFVERDIRFGTEGWQEVPLPIH